tara:strand:- start:79771 stop:79953 length:183 start_codon:yes stop_codon:yes gene_type:complete
MAMVALLWGALVHSFGVPVKAHPATHNQISGAMAMVPRLVLCVGLLRASEIRPVAMKHVD